MPSSAATGYLRRWRAGGATSPLGGFANHVQGLRHNGAWDTPRRHPQVIDKLRLKRFAFIIFGSDSGRGGGGR